MDRSKICSSVSTGCTLKYWKIHAEALSSSSRFDRRRRDEPTVMQFSIRCIVGWYYRKTTVKMISECSNKYRELDVRCDEAYRKAPAMFFYGHAPLFASSFKITAQNLAV